MAMIEEEKTAFITINRRKKESLKTILDYEDYITLKNYKWNISYGYVRNSKLGAVHRYIMKCPRNRIIDHLNKNKLDNRKINLRICTQQENQINSINKSKHRSIYKLESGYAIMTNNLKGYYRISKIKTLKEAKKIRNELYKKMYSKIDYEILIKILKGEEKYIAGNNTKKYIAENSVRVSTDIHKRLKNYCDEKGYRIKKIADNIFDEYLQQKEAGQ